MIPAGIIVIILMLEMAMFYESLRAIIQVLILSFRATIIGVCYD